MHGRSLVKPDHLYSSIAKHRTYDEVSDSTLEQDNPPNGQSPSVGDLLFGRYCLSVGIPITSLRLVLGIDMK